MQRAATRFLTLTAAVAAVVLVSRAEHSNDVSREAVEIVAEPVHAPKPLGLSSCASAACHGNPNAPSLTAAPGRDCWQSSLTHFLAVDPHRKAYEVLKSPHSADHGPFEKTFPVPIPDAWNDTRCLACHTNPTLSPETVPDEWMALRSEGVSCESCHGNAEQWKGLHTTWETVTRRKGLTDTRFVDLNGPRIRAETCAGCHLGAPAKDGTAVRDMNHDMIAAGHPELKFEFEKHLARLPKHWFERDRNGPFKPDVADEPFVNENATSPLTADREETKRIGRPANAVARIIRTVGLCDVPPLAGVKVIRFVTVGRFVPRIADERTIRPTISCR